MTLHVLHYSDVEQAYDSPESIGRLASFLDVKRRDETVVVGAGDNLSPGVLPLVSQGQQALDLFERVRPNVDVPGNHDFDYGVEPLLTVIRESPQTWLCANAWLDGDRFGADEGVEPWTTVATGDATVGLFGVAHPDTGAMAPNASDIRFTDAIEAAERAVRELRDEGVDYVVGVSHCGRDAPIARSVDADILLGGHEDDARTKRVEGTLLARTGGGPRVTEVRIDRDGRRTVDIHETADAPVDTAVTHALARRKRRAGLDTVVGHAASPLDRSSNLEEGLTDVGSFLAEAFRSYADADTALFNSGALRPGRPISGDVTTEDLLSLVPFPQPVVLVDLSGEEILETLRESGGRYDTFEDGEWKTQFSRLDVVWDATDDEVIEARVAGEPIRLDRTYSVATLLYVVLVDRPFQTIDESSVVREVGPHYDAIVEMAETEAFTVPEDTALTFR